MINFKLEQPLIIHNQLYINMMDEWEEYGGRINPMALKRNNATYEKWLLWIEEDKEESTCPKGSVPQDLYFFIKSDNGFEYIIGAVTIRKVLNNELGHNGSSFAFGIRPSERQKGYGKILLKLALEEAKTIYKYNKFILTCDQTNIASSKVIEANGGILQNKITEENGNVILRYMINN